MLLRTILFLKNIFNLKKIKIKNAYERKISKCIKKKRKENKKSKK